MTASPSVRQPSFRSSAVTVSVLLLIATLVTWVVTVERMRGMDAGPGTDLGGLGWFLGIWVTMTAAMMFPSVAPMVLLFHRVSREQEQPFVPTPVFVLSYLAVWTAYGFAAYALYRLVVRFDFAFLDWDRSGAYVAGVAIAAAGLYELTPLKSVCLRHCRRPLHFVLGNWRPGCTGAIRMGGEHGALCVGCCLGLMLVLFALGVMSLTWMAVVAVLIFAQKVLPRGEALTWAFAVVLVAAGVWVAAAPRSVPGLTLPTSDAANQARMRMMHMPPAQENHMRPAVRMSPTMRMRGGAGAMTGMGTRTQPAMTSTKGWSFDRLRRSSKHIPSDRARP